jgi:hypothetical protein
MMKKIMISIAVLGIAAIATVNVNLNSKSSNNFSAMILANLAALSNESESSTVIKCGQWISEELRESPDRYYRTYTCQIPGWQDVITCKAGKITYRKGLFGIHYDTEDNTTSYSCSSLY